MCFPRFAPVHPGFFVMDSVEAVIEEQCIQETQKISRVVPFRFLICMYVLNVIENEHGKKSDLLRNDDEKKRFFPVYNESYSDPKSQDSILSQTKPEISTIFRPLMLEVIANGLLLMVTADHRVSKQHEQMIMLSQAIGNCVIAFAIIQRVVVHVMRRNPREGREAIEHREPVIGKRVELFSAPDRDVIVVMSDNRNRDRKKQIYDIHGPFETECPLCDEQRGRQNHVAYCAPVGFVSKQGTNLSV